VSRGASWPFTDLVAKRIAENAALLPADINEDFVEEWTLARLPKPKPRAGRSSASRILDERLNTGSPPWTPQALPSKGLPSRARAKPTLNVT